MNNKVYSLEGGAIFKPLFKKKTAEEILFHLVWELVQSDLRVWKRIT